MNSTQVDALADSAAALAARGDGDAFETLCGLLSEDIWRYCLALLGDEQLAEEAAQETFVRSVTAIRRFKGRCHARVYLLVIARRCCAALLKREERHRSAPLDAAPDPATPCHGATVDLQLLLAALPVPLRQAFVLTQMLGLPYADAAVITGCPVGTVRSRVFRARDRLVAALAHDEEVADGLG